MNLGKGFQCEFYRLAAGIHIRNDLILFELYLNGNATSTLSRTTPGLPSFCAGWKIHFRIAPRALASTSGLTDLSTRGFCTLPSGPTTANTSTVPYHLSTEGSGSGVKTARGAVVPGPKSNSSVKKEEG